MKKPRILFWDTETRPVRAWVYGTGEQYIRHDQIIDGDKFDIICIAWKWLGEKEIHYLDWGCKSQNSEPMIKAFTKIIESADLPIAHNGDKFDVKQLNSQRAIHGLGPINWPTTEDTLKAFRKHFAFPSYSLDYLAKIFLGKGKSKMSERDWIDIVQYKKKDVLDKMIKYCKRDVRLLEGVYKKGAKFFAPKIHVGVFNGKSKTSCAKCGKDSTIKLGTKVTGPGVIKQRYQCKPCGYVFVGGLRA